MTLAAYSSDCPPQVCYSRATGCSLPLFMTTFSSTLSAVAQLLERRQVIGSNVLSAVPMLHLPGLEAHCANLSPKCLAFSFLMNSTSAVCPAPRYSLSCTIFPLHPTSFCISGSIYIGSEIPFCLTSPPSPSFEESETIPALVPTSIEYPSFHTNTYYFPSSFRANLKHCIPCTFSAC